MIQRVQTIWLLLAAIAGFLLTQVPVYVGSLAGIDVRKYSATENLLMFALSAVAALLGFIAIFLFKNRGLQQKVTTGGIFVSIALIAVEVWQITNFQTNNPTLKGQYYWGALLPIAMTVFFIMAAVNINRDNKLVKSLDRLR
jgi:hypothetical protein